MSVSQAVVASWIEQDTRSMNKIHDVCKGGRAAFSIRDNGDNDGELRKNKIYLSILFLSAAWASFVSQSFSTYNKKS